MIIISTNHLANNFILVLRQIPTPPRSVDHRARFNGWNLDERWKTNEIKWTGSEYNVEDIAAASRKGQRPVVAFVGSIGDTAAIQFVESASKVVGKYVHVCVNAN